LRPGPTASSAARRKLRERRIEAAGGQSRAGIPAHCHAGAETRHRPVAAQPLTRLELARIDQPARLHPAGERLGEVDCDAACWALRTAVRARRTLLQERTLDEQARPAAAACRRAHASPAAPSASIASATSASGATSVPAAQPPGRRRNGFRSESAASPRFACSLSALVMPVVSFMFQDWPPLATKDML
jgi:hypothetical protein